MAGKLQEHDMSYLQCLMMSSSQPINPCLNRFWVVAGPSVTSSLPVRRKTLNPPSINFLYNLITVGSPYPLLEGHGIMWDTPWNNPEIQTLSLLLSMENSEKIMKMYFLPYDILSILMMHESKLSRIVFGNNSVIFISKSIHK